MSQRNPKESGPKPPYPQQSQPHPGSEQRMDPEPDYGENSYKGFGRLQGKVALITGGDSGIGRAVALAFAREGADISISYLSEHEDAAITRKAVETSGRKALMLPGDIADPALCARLVADTYERFGRIDVIVNNAAFQGPSVDDISQLDPERLDRTFRTNVIAMFHIVRAAMPLLKPGASIINVTSIQAYDPKPAILDYASTKGAIVTFTKGLSRELLEKGIRVNAVAPGPVWTPLIAQSFDPNHVSKHGESNPMGRTAQPAELAPAFVFLACDESRFINGEVLGVTGGLLMP